MRRNDDVEFTRFAQAHIGRLRYLAYGVTGSWHGADELVQETLVRCFVNWSKVRAAQHQRAYVDTVLVRLAASQGRRASGRRSVENAHARDEFLRHGTHDPSRQVDDQVDLAKLLQGLTVKQRAVLVLRYLEDRPVAEVGQILGMSEGTVKRRSFEAIRRIRDRLGDEKGAFSRG